MKFDHDESNVLKACGTTPEEAAEVMSNLVGRVIIEKGIDDLESLEMKLTDIEKLIVIITALKRNDRVIGAILMDLTGVELDQPSRVVEYLYNTMTDDGVHATLLIVVANTIKDITGK